MLQAVIVSQRSLATLQSRLQQFVHNLNTATESGTFLQSVDAIQEIVRDITTCASMQQTELSSLLATLNRNRVWAGCLSYPLIILQSPPMSGGAAGDAIQGASRPPRAAGTRSLYQRRLPCLHVPAQHQSN